VSADSAAIAIGIFLMQSLIEDSGRSVPTLEGQAACPRG